MMNRALLRIAALIATIAFAAAANAQFKLTSPDIKPGGTISDEQVFSGFGCSGKNISPALKWSNPPKETKSFALLVHDADAPTGGAGWWHWLVINIPPNVNELPKGAGKTDGSGLPQGAVSLAIPISERRATADLARRPATSRITIASRSTRSKSTSSTSRATRKRRSSAST